MAFFWIKYVLHCFRILPEERHVEFLDTFDTFGCKYQVLDVSVKPDFDNMMKALMDALYEDDAHIWDSRVTKLWGEKGQIVIGEIAE